MEDKSVILRAQYVFDKVLGFIPRIDSKASVVFAINTGMLAFLFAHTPGIGAFSIWYMYVAAVPVILISISIWYLYQCGFPHLDGGDSSLIYFKEIARRTESKFIEEFKVESEENYLRDLLNQTHRNSEITRKKFEALKKAFVFTALAVLPWVISLAIFVSHNHVTISLK